MLQRGPARDKLGAVIARHDWITTSQIAEAVGVHPTTLQRWAKVGLLPEPALIARGRKGRSHWWPPRTIEQARWVKARIEELWTSEEILDALKRGDFTPGTSGSGEQKPGT